MTPATAHNSKLAAQLVALLNVSSRYPKVSEQIETVPLETENLNAFGYNPALIEHDGRIWFAYRFHRGSPSTRLAVAEITKDGKVLSNRTLDLPGKSQEDPRFFVFQGKLYLSYVDSEWPEKVNSIVKYGTIGDGTLENIVTLKLPGNDGTTIQKNYVFFEALGQLWCIYNNDTIYNVAEEFDAIKVDLKWPYGEPRGGCIIPWQGVFLRFFHSSLRNEWTAPPPCHRYFVGACIMNSIMPFSVLKVSYRPIVYGSEIDNIKVRHRPMLHWKRNVVFCSGAVKGDGHFLISLGVNDSACVLGKIKESELYL